MISRTKHTCLLPLFMASICSFANTFSFRNEKNCITEGKSSTCVLVSDCEYAINVIKRSSISSAKSQSFLKLYRCGFEGKAPKICCPVKTSIIDNRDAFKREGSLIQTRDEKEIDLERPGETNYSDFLPKTCGLQLSSRILGGENAEITEFPWLVALLYKEVRNKEPVIGCGGSLITKRYVLTAAHCIRTTSNVRLTNVRLGEYNLITEKDCVDGRNSQNICVDPAITVPIERKIVHEDFMSPKLYRNDIALLRLAYDVAYTPYIQPICLPIFNDTGKFYWSAGWGQTETKRSSDVKLKIQLPYFDFDQCAAKYRTKRVILGKGQMCAGGQAGKDTCRGDSGAPLMRQVEQAGRNNLWVIEGVLSLGTYDCGVVEWPAIYTKVNDYLPWIVSKLRP